MQYIILPMSTADLIADGMDAATIESAIEFKLLLQLGQSIEAVLVEEIDQDVDQLNFGIITTLSAAITIKGKRYRITTSWTNRTELLNAFIKFEISIPAQHIVTEYIKSLL